MKYELAKKLKDAGFPQKGQSKSKGPGCPHWMDKKHMAALKKDVRAFCPCDCFVYTPTLTELIEACGYKLQSLNQMFDVTTGESVGWTTNLYEENRSVVYSSPAEAVAYLWLALNKK